MPLNCQIFADQLPSKERMKVQNWACYLHTGGTVAARNSRKYNHATWSTEVAVAVSIRDDLTVSTPCSIGLPCIFNPAHKKNLKKKKKKLASKRDCPGVRKRTHPAWREIIP